MVQVLAFRCGSFQAHKRLGQGFKGFEKEIVVVIITATWLMRQNKHDHSLNLKRNQH